MRRSAIVMAVALGVLVIPGSALANHESSETAPVNCGYATGQDVNSGPGPVVVYADTAGGNAGSSGQADTAAGACASGLGAGVSPLVLDGGIAEAGSGTAPGGSGSYAVIDGSNANQDPARQSDGYIGVSNFETGANDSSSAPQNPDGCSNDGSGSNSGGCIGVLGNTTDVPPGSNPGARPPVPTPICGNTTGNSWDNTVRDGCEVP